MYANTTVRIVDWRIDKRKLVLALVASFAVHLFLAWLITFNKNEVPISKKKTPPIMDVVLLDDSQPSTKTSPSDAKTISNKNSTGQQRNAHDDRTRAARAPNATAQHQPKQRPRPLTPQQPQTPAIPQQQNKRNARILSRESDVPSLLTPNKTPETAKKPTAKPTPYIPLANLMPASAALTQFSREFDRERRMKQLLSKEADIGINTREAKYAPYAQGLVRALEEQWQPAGQHMNQLSSNERRVLMRVSINNNGELAGIKVVQPSPSRALNDSAVAAVHAAAPFKPLPSSWGLERANFFFVFEVVEDRAVFRRL
jgi:TonB family protein